MILQQTAMMHPMMIGKDEERQESDKHLLASNTGPFNVDDTNSSHSDGEDGSFMDSSLF